MMKLVIRTVQYVFFIFIAIPSSAQLTNSSQLEFEAAIRILNKGDFKEAVQRFDKLVISGFSNKDVYKYRGVAKYKLNDFKGAAEDLDKVRSSEDNDPQVLGLLGICKYQFHEWDAAKYFLIMATDTGFKDGKAHLYLGYLFQEAYQYKEAVTQLTEAEKAGENELKLFESRGISAFYSGDADLAIRDLEKFLKKGKASLVDFEILGLAYAQMDKLSKALPYLIKSDSLASENKKVYFQLGNCLSNKNLFTQAIEAYSKAIFLNFSEAEVFLNRGNAKVKAGLIGESFVDFDKVISLSPESTIGYRSRSVANLKLENWTGVITDLAIANALGNFEVSDRIALSVAKYNIKNFQGALDEVNTALEQGITSYVLEGQKYSFYFQKGKCLTSLKRFDEAVNAFDQAEKDGEKDVALYLERAHAYSGLHQFESAITDLEKAQLSSPNSPNVFYNSAVIKEEIGDFGAAVLDYNKAIQLNPKDALAYYGRASSKARKGDIGAAIADLDEAIVLDSKNASYYKARANYHYQMKNKDKACFDWRKAVEFGDAKARFSIDQYCNKK